MRKIFFKKLLVSLLLFVLLFLPLNVSSADLPNPLKGKTVPQIVGGIINAVLGLVGILALVMFIYGGILWMTSGGKPEQIKKGKDTLVWAIFGLALVFFSYALSNFVITKLASVAK